MNVTDANGDSRDYRVVDSFDVSAGALWSEVFGRVTGCGDSIAMQTCFDENRVRCMVAE